MKKIYLSLLTLLSGMLLTGCMNEDFSVAEKNGKGTYALSLVREDVQDIVISRAGEQVADGSYNVNDFKVKLSDKNGISIFQGKVYSELSAADRTLPVGTDYKIIVESCSQEEALTANDGWGQMRFTGETTFEIKNNETTPLEVNCTLQNAGLMVVFDESFTSKFPVYAATTQDTRALVFKGTTTGKVACYNVEEENNSISLKLTGSAGGWSDRINLVKEVSIVKGKIMRLAVIYDDNSGDLDIEFGTDNDMTDTNDDVTIQ
jgi:hypothetical protein